jgi:hypothetical protein
MSRNGHFCPIGEGNRSRRIERQIVSDKKPRALTPKRAARIRARANALEAEKSKRLQLARVVLFATGSYMGKHRQGPRPDDIENTAAARIFETYSGFVEAIQEGAPHEQILGGLGIYVVLLELLIAQLEEIISAQEEEIAAYHEALLPDAGIKSN